MYAIIHVICLLVLVIHVYLWYILLNVICIHVYNMSLMIDTVEIHIPINPIYVRNIGSVYELIGDVNDYGIYGSSRHIKKVNSRHEPIELYHAYESIPTSIHGIGFKFMNRANNCLPHAILNCSIAKLLQGHNVYGNLDMISGVLEMLGEFENAYPEFFSYLDVDKSEISKFDVTLPMRTNSKRTAIKIREYIRNVDFGRLRNQSVHKKFKKNQCFNTIYFGSPNSKVGGFKLYCKGVELEPVIADLQQKAKKGCYQSQKKLAVFTPELIDYADKSVRLEATIKKRMIREWGFPVNLWEFLHFQYKNDPMYILLFKAKTDDFFDCLKGFKMNYNDDVKVWDLLHSKLTTITPSGNTSTAKARNAYRFYKSLKSDGYDEVKKTTPKSTFHRHLKALTECGFSRGFLQNLSADKKETPIVSLINLDLNQPNPQEYEKKQTQIEYVERYANYLKIA